MKFETFSWFIFQLTDIKLVNVPERINRKGKIQSRFSCKNILIRDSKGSSSVSMLALVDSLSRSSLRWSSSSSQQSVTMLRMFLQETSENSGLVSSTSSSGTISISTSLTLQVDGGGWWSLGSIIMVLVIIIELSLPSQQTITGQLRPSVLWRSWNPGYDKVQGNILLLLKIIIYKLS